MHLILTFKKSLYSGNCRGIEVKFLVAMKKLFVLILSVLLLTGCAIIILTGRNPREATAFWQRMSTAGGGSPPEFLSTHPSDETRLRKLQQLIPEAMKYYTPRN